MKKMKIFILAAALAVCGLMTLAACETPDDTVHTHSFGEWEVVTEPTCTEEGKLERTCSCGEKETSSISALGHGKEMTVRENEVAATCTESGSYEDVVYCSVCGEEMSRKTVEIPAAGHKPGAAATCINAQVCSVCGTVLAPMLAHTPGEPVRVEEIPATCTEGGSYEEVISCTVCETELSRKTAETLAPGHDYVNGVCTRCHDVLVTEGLKFQLSADSSSYIVSDHVGYSTEVYIPSVYEGLPVTAIGDRALEGSERMMRIVLPDTITSIGNSAFSGCLYLEDLTIPDGVTFIGGGAFRDCSSLESITIPDGVTSIGEGTFSGCSGLTSITIPDSVTSFGREAFYGCIGLTSIVIPDGVTSTGYSAFQDCSNLTSIVIPDSVTSIDGNAFWGCSSLTSITLPDSVTSISACAFLGCSSLTSIVIPSGVTGVDYATFSGCSSLTSVALPDGFTKIGEQAFSGCSGLTSIVIPDSVISIASRAFEGCSSLTSIVIPDSVTSIGGGAFGGCSSLTSITVNEGNPVYHSGGNCLIETESKTLIAGCGASVIPSDGSVTSIDRSAFSGCSSLTNITIPDGVISIGGSAFGDGAFSFCSSLTSIVIPDSVTFIGEMAFYGCGSLTTVYYRGSEEEWNMIVNISGNYELENAEFVFNYTGE